MSILKFVTPFRIFQQQETFITFLRVSFNSFLSLSDISNRGISMHFNEPKIK